MREPVLNPHSTQNIGVVILGEVALPTLEFMQSVQVGPDRLTLQPAKWLNPAKRRKVELSLFYRVVTQETTQLHLFQFPETHRRDFLLRDLQFDIPIAGAILI